MQPDWRVDDKDKELTALARTAAINTDDEWSNSALLHAGPIGFHLVIMGLGWWGQVVNLKDKDEQDTGKFLEAVEDVHWVLKQILNSFPSKQMTKKRLAENDDSCSSNKR